MNTESVNCHRVKVPLNEGTISTPGDFAWDFDSDLLGGDHSKPTHYLYICLPGETNLTAIEVQQGNNQHGPRTWAWDGNEDKPTLSPSILFPGTWHGYLKSGRLESC
jgi:hypothetical protein